MNYSAAPSSSVPAPPRSVFVTALGWLVVVGSALASMISCISAIMIMVGSYGTSTSDPLGFLIVVVAPPVTFVAGIGLLRRKSWARFYLVALLVAVLASNAWQLFRSPAAESTYVSADGVPTTTLESPALYSIPVMVICVGLLVKLLSARVRSEFRTSSVPGLFAALRPKK